MERLFFSQEAILLPEADFLLRSEFSVVHTYASILRAVAAGATRMQEIANRVGSDSRTVSRYLPMLMELGYLRRETSLDDPTPEKSRKGYYRVSDSQLRFHFRFVQPHREVIDRGDGMALFDHVVVPAMPTFCGAAFEDVMREKLAREAVRLFGAPALRSGRLYGSWGEIDLALELMDGSWVLAECKATRSRLSSDILHALRSKASNVRLEDGKAVHLCLASLSGFSQGLKTEAAAGGVVLVGLADDRELG